MTSSQNWKEYERVVSDIVSQIYETVEGITPEQVGHGPKNHMKGASGYAHQIDVSVVGPQDLILIECKHWSRNVTVESVLTFFGRVYDIRPTFNGQTHCELVTTKGFQPGAEILAEYFNIGLQLIKSPNEYIFKFKGLSRHASWHKVNAILSKKFPY